LQLHGVDHRQPAVARILALGSDSGYVMYKQFFRDLKQASDQQSGAPQVGNPTPGMQGSMGGASSGLGGSSMQHLGDTVSIGDLGGGGVGYSAMDGTHPPVEKQKLAKSRIQVAELKMENEKLRDNLIEADVERKGMDMELQGLRRQLRESRGVELQAIKHVTM